MTKPYTPQQIDKVLETLPEELKDAVFSTETADAVWQVCKKQNIMDERMSKIAEYAGYVLMGLLSPQGFKEKLQKEIKLPEKTAEELDREINRFVFYPVKPALEAVYKVGISSPTAPTGKAKSGEKIEEKSESVEPPKRKDTYREKIE